MTAILSSLPFVKGCTKAPSNTPVRTAFRVMQADLYLEFLLEDVLLNNQSSHLNHRRR